jgi:hypothetical protein
MVMNARTGAPVATQRCSTNGCVNPAAYRTRSKPAWCTDCIDDILRVGGLSADEPFTGPKDWRLTTCVDCGVQAHYRFNYTLEKNAQGEKTCRACYWTEWAKEARQLSGSTTSARIYSLEEIVAHLDANGYDFIATTVDVNDGNDPIIVRCRSCGRRSAERMGDIGWGCSCSRNVRADTPTSAKALVVPARNIRSVNPASTIPSRQLLADSDDPAREWWDHDRNDEANYQTVTLRASRTAQWICPECGHSFLAKVLEMTSGRHSCPACSATREAAWHEEYERWKATPVSDLPELAAAWAERPTHAQSWSREEINTASGAPPAITPEFHRSGSSSLAAPTAAPIRRGKRRRTGSPISSPKSPPNGTRQGTASSPLIASSGIPSAKCGGWPIAATMNGKPPP